MGQPGPSLARLLLRNLLASLAFVTGLWWLLYWLDAAGSYLLMLGGWATGAVLSLVWIAARRK